MKGITTYEQLSKTASKKIQEKTEVKKIYVKKNAKKRVANRGRKVSLKKTVGAKATKQSIIVLPNRVAVEKYW